MIFMTGSMRLSPHDAGQLTQFQALGGSLLEATEQQTQPVLDDSTNKHTLSTMKCVYSFMRAVHVWMILEGCTCLMVKE